MAEILGVGVTHSPSLISPDELKNYSLTRALRNEKIPPEKKNPENWPAAMREEWGDDEGYTSALYQREKLVAGFRKVRAELDAFKPDVVLVWGDDQYENFKEDIIPAFCVMAHDEYECRPFAMNSGATRPNVWDEPAEKTFRYKGHPSARYLTGALIDEGFDVAYAYRPLHEPGLGHAFLNTLLYLDYDRDRIRLPGHSLRHQLLRQPGHPQPGRAPAPQVVNGVEMPADPPGPSPKRCMELGAAAARALQDSPWRVALIASSSWSHAFLTEKNWWLHCDVDSDRERFEELKAGELRGVARADAPPRISRTRGSRRC